LEDWNVVDPPLEDWNNGLRRVESFFDTLGKSEINPPAADRFYTQYSIFPSFHRSIRRLMAAPPLWSEIKAGPSGTGFFTIGKNH
jgi:hypothetical protein